MPINFVPELKDKLQKAINQVGKNKKPYIEIEVGTCSFKVKNTKDALQFILKEVGYSMKGFVKTKNVMKTNFLPKLSKKTAHIAPYYIVVPDGMENTPVPASPRRVSTLKTADFIQITGESDFVTNGHFAVKKSLVPVAKKIPITSDRVIPASVIDKSLKKQMRGTGVQSFEVGRIIKDWEVIKKIAVFSDGKLKVAFQITYIDWLHKNVTDFNLAIRKPPLSSFIKSGKKKVGVIMPMNLQTWLSDVKVVKST